MSDLRYLISEIPGQRVGEPVRGSESDSERQKYLHRSQSQSRAARFQNNLPASWRERLEKGLESCFHRCSPQAVPCPSYLLAQETTPRNSPINELQKLEPDRIANFPYLNSVDEPRVANLFKDERHVEFHCSFLRVWFQAPMEELNRQAMEDKVCTRRFTHLGVCPMDRGTFRPFMRADRSKLQGKE